MQSTKVKKLPYGQTIFITSFQWLKLDCVLAKPVEAGKCRQVYAYYLSDHSLYKLRKFNHSQDRLWQNTAEIHLRSLIRACSCMRVYMNSAVLMRENVAEKKWICEKRIDLTTSADCPLDNHLVCIRIS